MKWRPALQGSSANPKPIAIVRGHVRRHHLARFRKWSVRYRVIETRQVVRILALHHDSGDPDSELQRL
jgi:hypothetical protein